MNNKIDSYPELLATYTDDDGQSVYISFRPHAANRSYGGETPEQRAVERPIKRIGAWSSGGADSTSNLFLLAKTITDMGLDIVVQPITFKHYAKPWNATVARRAVDALKEKTGFTCIGEHVFVDMGTTYDKAQHSANITKYCNDAFNSGEFDCIYGATTLNPPSGHPLSENTDRASDRDVDKQDPNLDPKLHMSPQTSTYKLVDKRFTAWVYKHFELDDILPLTRSCELVHEQTANYQHNCYTLEPEMREQHPWFIRNPGFHCWWCQERDWAFTRYEMDGRAWVPTAEMTQRGFVCPVFNVAPDISGLS